VEDWQGAAEAAVAAAESDQWLVNGIKWRTIQIRITHLSRRILFKGGKLWLKGVKRIKEGVSSKGSIKMEEGEGEVE